jgi:large subunit ribosomal protein L23
MIDRKANKFTIKTVIEYLFNVTVLNVNTLNQPKKKKTIGRFSGYKARYKKQL